MFCNRSFWRSTSKTAGGAVDVAEIAADKAICGGCEAVAVLRRFVGGQLSLIVVATTVGAVAAAISADTVL